MHDVAKIAGLFIPILAIVGAFVMIITRIVTQARLEELVRKERIAAIERGVDPAKLQPITGSEFYALGDNRLRRAHGLMIGGLILLAIGIGLTLVLYVVEPHERQWTIGIVPLFVGAALLLSSRIIWPREGERKS